jgi:FlaA1/EpsC-like NDP-sugar epimerase
MLSRSLNRLGQLPLSSKRLILRSLDFGLCLLALFVVWDISRHATHRDPLEFATVAAPLAALTVVLLSLLGVYGIVTRYISGRAYARIFIGTLAGSGYLLFVTRDPILCSAYTIVAAFLLSATRTAAKVLLGDRTAMEGRPVAIYGAGRTGRRLAFLLDGNVNYRPAVFLDDDPHLIGRMVAGLLVHDPSSPNLESELSRRAITDVILAMPSISPRTRGEMLQKLKTIPMKVHLSPVLDAFVPAQEAAFDLVQLRIEDLLGREPVQPVARLLAASITDQAVLVTGAAGSIGSELCRQAIKLRPRVLIALDQGEHALYQLDRELQAAASTDPEPIAVVPILGSATDRRLLDSVIEEHQVETLYHAAAYKHVPLVQKNAIAATFNNCISAHKVAEAARAGRVRNCVLISSDKAVEPTSVMGATKRVAELVFQAYAQRSHDTCFSAVRFGNVLNSSGSVVPLFREQIEKGGPVTGRPVRPGDGRGGPHSRSGSSNDSREWSDRQRAGKPGRRYRDHLQRAAGGREAQRAALHHARRSNHSTPEDPARPRAGHRSGGARRVPSRS